MAEISAEQLSDFAYQRLPDIYKVRDFEIDEERPPLLNFLKAMFLGSGGITKAKKYQKGAGEQILDVANKFTSIIDPENCPDNVFPYLLKSFGYDYDELIETQTFKGSNIYYQRKLLMNIGELYKRRGTMSAVKFMARTLTGLDVEDFEYKRGEIEDKPNVYARHLIVYLKANIIEQILNQPHSTKVIEEFLHIILPFYINIEVKYKTDGIIFEMDNDVKPHIGAAGTYTYETDIPSTPNERSES